jgi:hypothetical protein
MSAKRGLDLTSHFTSLHGRTSSAKPQVFAYLNKHQRPYHSNESDYTAGLTVKACDLAKLHNA